MAEIQTAEEDDDEGFGDFKFVNSSSPQSAYPNPTTFQFSQIKSLNFISSKHEDDDEWGDFVDNSSPLSLRSDPSPSLLTSVRSLPSHPSKPIDPFNHLSNHPLNRVESDTKLWVKPQGALPLSLFGYVEGEDEEEGVRDEGSTEKQVDSRTNGSNLDMPASISGSEPIKVENEASSSSNGFGLVFGLGNKIEQIKSEKELNSSSSGLNTNLNSNLDDFSFINMNGLNEVSKVSYNGSEPVNVGNGTFFGPKGLNSTPNSNGLDLRENGLDSNCNVGEEDFDEDDGWDFQGADSHNDREDLDSKVDQKRQENSGLVDKTPRQLDIEFDFKPTTVTQNCFLIESYPRLNHNAGVNGYSHKGDGHIDTDMNFWDLKDNSKQMQNTRVESGFLLGPPSANKHNERASAIESFVETGSKYVQSAYGEFSFLSGSESTDKQNESASESFPVPIIGKTDTDDNFWEFKVATSEIFVSKHKEETDVADFSHGGFDGSSRDGQMQKSDILPEGKKGIPPMSLFSEENMDTDDSFNLHEDFAFQSPSNIRNGTSSQSPSVSFDDLISNLYSQAAPSMSSTQEATISKVDSIPVELDSNEINSNGDEDSEDFDDASWDFKVALSDISSKNQTPVLTPDNIPIKSKMKIYMEFYAELKDELCQVVHFHLDTMKKAKTRAALSSDDVKFEALDDEIKEAYKQLNLANILAEVETENHLPRINSLSRFLGTLHEPKFQLLESEYCLSSKLTLSEKDLKSAIALLSHAASMLKIFNLRPIKEQAEYVSAWSRMISVCCQELRHGASVLLQASHRSVYRQVLSDVRGQQFMLALGEIFRVVEIIGVVVQLYKPWILSNLDEPTGVFDPLKECSSIWSSCGIGEALRSISDSFGTEYERIIKSLLESIECVHDLDADALQPNVLISSESTCRLTLLTPEKVPGLNLVAWNGHPYFVTAANLWANLIDSDPPKLAHIRIG